MGIFDIFRRLLADRNNADASFLQDIRRKDNAERARRREEQKLQNYLKVRSLRQQQIVRMIREQQSMRMTLRQPFPRGQPKLSTVPISEILGFQSLDHRRKRRY